MEKKAKEEVLLGQVADFFNQYLKSGVIDYSSFTQDIDPNLNIDNINRLLRLHFVLTSKESDGTLGVLDFMEELPSRLRRIKTATGAEAQFFEGEVRGKIDWDKTVKIRLNSNPKDKTIYSCKKIQRNYDIPENLVLKRLLQIIYSIIFEDLRNASRNKFDWLKEWTYEKELSEVLKSAYLKNAYLKRIDLGETAVTPRMIARTSKSRLALYRDAAALLNRYNRLMAYNIDAQEAKSILRNTFIKPKQIETLFEFYWVIEIIKRFGDVRLQLIEEGSAYVAHWYHNDYRYEIYHNSSAGFNFVPQILAPTPNQPSDAYYPRKYKAIKEFEYLTLSEYFGNLRPDVILKKIDHNGIVVAVLIGEVKYTLDKMYALQGLKELLTYMAYLQDEEKYVEDVSDLFTPDGTVIGILFTDALAESIILKDDRVKHIVLEGKDALGEVLSGF